jgi:hypothetical protein
LTVFAGIDYSLSSPALCVFENNGSDYCFKNVTAYFRSNLKRFELFKEGNIHGENHKPFKCDMDRYDDISDWAASILDGKGVTKVFLEGYSFGSTGRVFNIAENTAILKYNLWDAQIDIEVIAPTTIKKFATGSGRASKELMYEKFCEENSDAHLKEMLTPRSSNIINPVSDIVDAYYILKYGIWCMGERASRGIMDNE